MEFNSVTVVRPYEQIVSQIQGAIRDGQFVRGARLPTERELSESFGVSRSVVREAVKVLGAMGLVESRQGSGLYVRSDSIQTVSRAFILSVSPDAESVDRLFEFRQGLEMEAARLAVQRRTDVNLATMQEAAGNAPLAAARMGHHIHYTASVIQSQIPDCSGNRPRRTALDR